jgi:hypothetical protein
VYVEQFSAHPLESDAAELYGPPDGYIGADGMFRQQRQSSSDKPVYEIELKPDDGLYPLPYMATQADGSAWEEECTAPGAVSGRQGFFPDGSRSFEEIDRLSIGAEGIASLLSSIATVDFYRGVPPAVTPRAYRRIYAAITARATSRRKFVALISSATSLITLPSRRLGRHWRKRPTTCKRSCRAATTTV